MDQALINECKTYIEIGDLSGLQNYYNELLGSNFEISPNWQYIYHRIYLHACLKKKQVIADWLTSIFSTFDPVTQIALRQIFPYGRYLLAR
jgi:hypothetical protein